jgi:hypothetical protein
MFAQKLIDILKNSIIIEKYKIMFIINRINKKNRRMFFNNIIHMLFIDVILMFVTRFKKQNCV